MEGRVVTNESTGELAIWDGKNLNPLPGKVVTNEKTGAKALWDGKSLMPVKIDIDPNQPTAKADKAVADKLLSPEDLALKTSPQGFSPAPVQSPIQVMETLNAPIDYVGDVAGRAVQNLIDPVKNPTLSDVGGGLTKAAIQYFGPQAIATGARLAAKAATALAPGAQGGRMESLIGKTDDTMQGLLGKAQKSEVGFGRAVSNIPAGTRTKLPATARTLDNLIASEEAAGMKDATFLRDAKALRKKIIDNKDLRWVDGELTRIGAKTKAVMGTQANPGYKAIFAAMADDLERPTAVAAKPGPVRTLGTNIEEIGGGGMTGNPTAKVRMPNGEMWQPAELPPSSVRPPSATIMRPGAVEPAAPAAAPVKEVGSRGVVIRAKDEAIRRRKGIEDVIDEFNNLVKTKRGQAGAQDINANQLMDKLRKNDFLQASLRKEDWDEITPLLEKLADTAALPAARGVSYGSGRALSRGAIAGGIASMTGLDPMTTAGAVTAIDYATGHLLMTRNGRSLVKAVLESKFYEPSQKLNIINGMGLLAEKGINKAMEQ